MSKTILITGASSGIGKATAKIFAKNIPKASTVTVTNFDIFCEICFRFPKQ